MLTVLGYLLITSFLLLVIKQKLSPFTGLIVVSLAVGVLVCLVNGVPMGTIMTWVREG